MFAGNEMNVNFDQLRKEVRKCLHGTSFAHGHELHEHAPEVGHMLRRTVEIELLQSAIEEYDVELRRNRSDEACLEGLGVQDCVGEGADGKVYRLASGKAAKVSHIRVGGHHSLDNVQDIVNALHNEHTLNKRAGEIGVSPKVFSSFVCVSGAAVTHVIVMELIEGDSLYKWLRQDRDDGALNAMYAKVRILLDKLHGAGIMHNDLHTGNVMVTRDDVPYIIDFSRAGTMQDWKELDAETVKHTVVPKGVHRVKIDDLAELVAHELIVKGVLTLT